METGTVTTTAFESNGIKSTTECLSEASTEINFEELIKASNVTPRISKEDSNEEKSKTTHDLKAENTSKILPKTNTTVAKTANPGQVVIIQSPTGAPLPIRIGNSNAAATGKQSTPVTIQVLKMPDGSLVPIKSNKALNLTNLTNVTQLNVNAKKSSAPSNSTVIVKSSTAPSLIGTNSKTGSGTNIGVQLLKSLGGTDSQKIVGSAKPKTSESNGKQLTKILPASSTITTQISSSSATNSRIKVAQKLILPENKEIKIKTEGETGTKQILIPQHLLKISPNNSAPIQAIQIPGKPGLQYVRVLGTTGSPGSGNTTKGNTTLAAVRSKELSPSKMTVVPQIVSSQKVLMTGKPRANTSLTANKESAAGVAQVSGKQNIKPLITTVPTLRKISEPGITKTVTILKKEDESATTATEITKIKMSHLNQHHKKVSSSLEPNNVSNQQQNTKTQLLMVTQELFRQMQSTDSTGSNVTTERSPPKKLYSVLKPSSDPIKEQYHPGRKRSPSPEGVRRKHCNCTKSQCLKLYCDCFANGEFCQDCNCKECFNNLEYEDERQKAIRICLERNPNAFKPKITKARDQSEIRLHNKGCNCKRSGCLKNYCECYEARIACSSNCKCFGCRNVEDRSEMDPIEVAKIAQNFGRGVSSKRPFNEIADKTSSCAPETQPPPNKQPYNYITQDVVDATIQCMIAQADESRKSGVNTKSAEGMVLEELGRCLVEIIDFSIRNMDN